MTVEAPFQSYSELRNTYLESGGQTGGGGTTTTDTDDGSAGGQLIWSNLRTIEQLKQGWTLNALEGQKYTADGRVIADSKVTRFIVIRQTPDGMLEVLTP